MKFSIITPSYNQLEHLQRCVASVADQSGLGMFGGAEHLVQDGCSGAGFDAWATSQKSAKVVSEPDKGMYDAINRGFSRASGNLLAWLNCDEQYLPGTLAKVAKWFDGNPKAEILFGDVVLVSSDGIPLGYRQAIRPLRGHVRNCFLPTFSAATFFRRTIVDAGHSFDPNFRAIADAVWVDGILGAGRQVGILNEPLAIFTQTGENLGQSSVSKDESAKWRGWGTKRSRLRRLFWSNLHSLRKLRSGAYRSRNVEISIHLDATSGRVLRTGVIREEWVC